MSIRRLRQVLTHLTVIVATLAAVLLFQLDQQQQGARETGRQIIGFCHLPNLPEEIVVRHAVIDRSEDPNFVDVILTLTGPTDPLNNWLKQFDQWEKNRPGIIQNHRTRESEMSSRFDFTAEVYLQ